MDDVALSEWLRLREDADWRSRSVALTEAIADRLPRNRPVRVLDLATGTGSNFRYLVERLPEPQQWLLVDRSGALLSQLASRTRDWADLRGYEVREISNATFWVRGPRLDCHVELRTQDLATLGDASIFDGQDLVTASALLDLVSESWLRRVAARCRAVGAAALFTITYDGRFSCTPAEPEDEVMRARMNAHQRRDKGLGGPAEGPFAVASAKRCFAAEGYRVITAASDWVLDASVAAMQRVLIDGWAEAASDIAPDDDGVISSWRERRQAHVTAGRSHLVVGHHDIAAWSD